MFANGRVYVTGGNTFYFSLTLYPIPSMSKLMNLLTVPAWNIHFVCALHEHAAHTCCKL